jgi:2-(1,2-epoxy-1,2-dihydrophenyl)acetyl-CoA isomerase
LGLALVPDIAIAARSARFTMAYTQIGASPDGGSTFYLPRLIGLRRALELTYENRVLSADEALQWGLINSVVDDAELLAVARGRALALAEGPTRAFGAARRLLHAAHGSTLEGQLTEEGRSIAAMSGSLDFAEGVGAFGDKRKAVFRGE